MGEWVVLDTRSGKVHQLNAAAACIWRNLEDYKDVESIAAILCEEFGIDERTALRDAEVCLAELGSLGLLEEPAK